MSRPWVNAQLGRRLAHWAFKVCTAGGFELPAFALADDGYLFCYDGETAWFSVVAVFILIELLGRDCDKCRRCCI